MLLVQLFLLPLIHYYVRALNSATGYLFASLSHSRKEVPNSALSYNVVNQKSSIPVIYCTPLYY